MKTQLEGKKVTIQQDGWSNVKEDPIIATCESVDGKCYFLDAKEPGAKKKSADICKDMLRDSISTAEKQYGCKVVNVVTDNEAKMKKMRQELAEEAPNLNTYSCMSHNLNLLAREVSKPEIMEHVKSINHYFKHVHRAHGWLAECPGHVKPQLPCLTRWSSDLSCLESFLTNHTIYKKIANEHKVDMDSTIFNKIKNIGLLSAAEDLADQLRPICKVLTICQSDSTSIAEATNAYFNLLQEPILKQHKDVLDRRFKQAIQPCHLAAYFLHPKFQGEHLSTEQKEEAKAWIMKQGSDFLGTVIAFEAQGSPFPPSYFHVEGTAIHPLSWWELVAKSCLQDSWI